MRYFISTWSKLTSDRFILDCVGNGYKIEFIEQPFQNCVPKQNLLNAKDEVYMDEVLGNLLNEGVVTEVSSHPKQFISTYFLVKKPNGDYRFVLNLKKLNKFIATNHFKMEDIRTAMKLISRDSFMATLDLKEAYFLVPIHLDSKKYLRFIWQGKVYEFCALPFGLNTAPWLFTKLLKPVVNYLRKQGFSSVVYLDDWLCIGNSYTDCVRNVDITIKVLESLGFIINWFKSTPVPHQRCQFLGFVLNSLDMLLELPKDKRINILNLIEKFDKIKSCSIREFASFVGIIVAACPAIKYGWLYSKNLERQKYLSLLKNKGNYDSLMTLPENLTYDLRW